MTTVGLGVGKRAGWFVNTISTDVLGMRQTFGKNEMPTDHTPTVLMSLKHPRAIVPVFLRETWKYMHLLAQNGWLK